MVALQVDQQVDHLGWINVERRDWLVADDQLEAERDARAIQMR